MSLNLTTKKLLIFFLLCLKSSWDDFTRPDEVSYWHLTILPWFIRVLPSRNFCFYLNGFLNELINSKILRQVRCFLFLLQKLKRDCRNCNQNVFVVACAQTKECVENNGSSLLLLHITLFIHSCYNPTLWPFLISSRARHSHPCLFSIQ